MKTLKEALEKQERIACLLTLYEKDSGNCTKVIFSNNREILLYQSIHSVLKVIAKHYSLDLNELRKKQQKLLNDKNYIPLPISRDILLISVKTRFPKVKGDSSISYINYYEIDRIDKKEPILYLKGGKPIQSLNSIATLKKRYVQGEICSKLQNSSQNFNFEIAESAMPYFLPATKGDIKAIARELENLKELLNRILITKK
ncbi:hypothetical protein [Alkaliphilus oremlandii]|uniref:Uncharacterized protein n=1 Tax=Alkaliphilus oremlandii (strain OhILAs) TaxID=350688 RepID=A8MK07_ALKOO|nr:hypothetical protein [Alkaliphilus oremlandii]ABW20139.1 hypothetical protein Clos_2608 [Alkaliphilus oremlandii OhILAs]